MLEKINGNCGKEEPVTLLAILRKLGNWLRIRVTCGAPNMQDG